MCAEHKNNTELFWVPALAFFLSGATGLVYEVVWTRMLSTIVGSTVSAAGIVMAVFLGGLALGARVFGPLADKAFAPLRMYALLEAGVAVFALATTTALSHVCLWHPIFSHLPGVLGGVLGKIAIAGVFLLVPAMFMGGTLPVLSRCVVPSFGHLGRSLGILYGLNTLGALTGCLFSGFYLMEHLGFSGACTLSAAINLAIFAVCFSLSSKWDSPAPGNSCKSDKDTVSHTPPRDFLWAYAASGATALAWEVLWIRLLSTTTIGTSYAFAGMLATCLGGMAMGSLIFHQRADTVSKPFLWFAGMQMLVALWGGLLLFIYRELPLLQGLMTRYFGPGWTGCVVEMVLLSMALVLVPSLLFGAMFPLAGRIWCGGRAKVAGNVGQLYTANTLGCVAGSLGAGLILLPQLGIQHTLALVGGVNGGLALYGVVKSRARTMQKCALYFAMPASLVLAFYLVPADFTARITAGRLHKPWILMSYHEGRDSNIMILENEQTGVRRLMTTFFQYIGDTSTIMLRIQKLQAHLPMLLSGHPQNVLFVGMGTGITPAAATVYPSKITCCEISRGVMDAARFFALENKNILENPKVQMVHGDGRHYLLATDQHYDLIVGDLYNATLAGMVSMYTKEYYTLCLSHLTQNAMMCQWISMKDFPEKELKGVMATFGQVFPHTSLWCATPGILAMIGTRTPLNADLKQINDTIRSTPGLPGVLEQIGIASPVFLLAHFLMNQDAWHAFAGNAPVITDNTPYIEYSIPKSLHYLNFKKDMPVTLRHINAGRTFLIPPDSVPHDRFSKALARIGNAETHLFSGYAYFLEDHFTQAHQEYLQALSLNPRDKDATLFERLLEQSIKNKNR